MENKSTTLLHEKEVKLDDEKTASCQASVFIGTILDNRVKVAVKSYNEKQCMKSFLRELKIFILFEKHGHFNDQVGSNS